MAEAKTGRSPARNAKPGAENERREDRSSLSLSSAQLRIDKLNVALMREKIGAAFLSHRCKAGRGE